MPVEEGLIRHFILNSIRANNKKFRNEYGEMIICCDSRSWRKSQFPEYKANRTREADSDWDIIFKAMNDVRTVLEDYSPMKVIKADGCEADDIIAWYANKHGSNGKDEVFGGIGTTSEDILIISGDKDFQQLQMYKNVYQYSPTLKTYIKCPDADRFYKEMIAKGDVGDGVPNVISADRTLVDGIRQKPITKNFLDDFVANFDDISRVKVKIPFTEFERNFHRNVKLIKLIDDGVPADVQSTIEEEVRKDNKGSLGELRKVFIEFRLKNLLETVADFGV